jgi:hypothetical protein
MVNFLAMLLYITNGCAVNGAAAWNPDCLALALATDWTP